MKVKIKKQTKTKRKCVKCGKYACMDSPQDLCIKHWTDWFTKGWPKDKTLREIYQENKQQCREFNCPYTKEK